MLRKVSTIIMAMIVAGEIVGCVNQGIEDQWTKSISNLGIEPVYPPRENVYVGQIYLKTKPPHWYSPEHLYMPLPAKAFGEQSRMIYVGSLPLRQAANDPASTGIYADPAALAWSADMAADAAVASGATWDEPESVLGSTVIPTRYRLLKQVAFPAFTLATVSGVDAGINLPTVGGGGVLGGKAGFSHQGNTSVSVSIPEAESYAVGTSRMLDALATDCAAVPAASDGIGKAGYARLALLHGAKKSGKSTVFTVLYDVYYARSINVTMTTSDQNGFQAGITTKDLATLSASNQALETALSGLAASNGSPATAAGSDSLSLAKSTVQTINNTLQQAVPSQPGFTTDVVHSSASSITLVAHYKYPVAVGYRAVDVLLDTSTCDINGAAVTTGGAAALY